MNSILFCLHIYISKIKGLKYMGNLSTYDMILTTKLDLQWDEDNIDKLGSKINDLSGKIDLTKFDAAQQAELAAAGFTNASGAPSIMDYFVQRDDGKGGTRYEFSDAVKELGSSALPSLIREIQAFGRAMVDMTKATRTYTSQTEADSKTASAYRSIVSSGQLIKSMTSMKFESENAKALYGDVVRLVSRRFNELSKEDKFASDRSVWSSRLSQDSLLRKQISMISERENRQIDENEITGLIRNAVFGMGSRTKIRDTDSHYAPLFQHKASQNAPNDIFGNRAIRALYERNGELGATDYVRDPKEQEMAYGKGLYAQIKKMQQRGNRLAQSLAIETGLASIGEMTPEEIQKTGHDRGLVLRWRANPERERLQKFLGLATEEGRRIRSGQAIFQHDADTNKNINKQFEEVLEITNAYAQRAEGVGGEEFSRRYIEPASKDIDLSKLKTPFVASKRSTKIQDTTGKIPTYGVPYTTLTQDENGNLVFTPRTEEEMQKVVRRTSDLKTKDTDKGIMLQNSQLAALSGLRPQNNGSFAYIQKNGKQLPAIVAMPISNMWERDEENYLKTGGEKRLTAEGEIAVKAINEGATYNGERYRYVYTNGESATFQLEDEYNKNIEKARRRGISNPYESYDPTIRQLVKYDENGNIKLGDTNKLIMGAKRLGTQGNALTDMYPELAGKLAKMKYSAVDLGAQQWISKQLGLQDLGRLVDGAGFIDPSLSPISFQVRGLGEGLKGVLGNYDWRDFLKRTVKATPQAKKSPFMSFNKKGELTKFLMPSVAFGKLDETTRQGILDAIVNNTEYTDKGGTKHNRADLLGEYFNNVMDKNVGALLFEEMLKTPTQMTVKTEDEYLSFLTSKENGYLFGKAGKAPFTKKQAEAELEKKKAAGLTYQAKVRRKNKEGIEEDVLENFVRLNAKETNANIAASLAFGRGLFAVKSDEDFSTGKRFIGKQLAEAIGFSSEMREASARYYAEQLDKMETDDYWINEDRFSSRSDLQNLFEQAQDKSAFLRENRQAMAYIDSQKAALRKKSLTHYILPNNTATKLAFPFMGTFFEDAIRGYGAGISDNNAEIARKREELEKLGTDPAQKEARKALEKEIEQLQNNDLSWMYRSKLQDQDYLKERFGFTDEDLAKVTTDGKIDIEKIMFSSGAKNIWTMAGRTPSALNTFSRMLNLESRAVRDDNGNKIRSVVGASLAGLRGGGNGQVAMMAPEAIYRMNTGDFDGDTVWMYAHATEEMFKEMEKYNKYAAFDPNNPEDVKAQQEIETLIQEQMKELQERKAAGTFGERVSEELYNYFSSQGEMGKSSALMRNALDLYKLNTDEGRKKFLHAYNLGSRYYDMATSEGQKMGWTGDYMHDYGRAAYMASRQFSRFEKQVGDYALSNGEGEIGPSIFKNRLVSLNNLMGLADVVGAAQMRQRNGVDMGFGDMVNDWVDAAYGIGSEGYNKVLYDFAAEWAHILTGQRDMSYLASNEELSNFFENSIKLLNEERARLGENNQSAEKKRLDTEVANLRNLQQKTVISSSTNGGFRDVVMTRDNLLATKNYYEGLDPNSDESKFFRRAWNIYGSIPVVEQVIADSEHQAHIDAYTERATAARATRAALTTGTAKGLSLYLQDRLGEKNPSVTAAEPYMKHVTPLNVTKTRYNEKGELVTENNVPLNVRMENPEYQKSGLANDIAALWGKKRTNQIDTLFGSFVHDVFRTTSHNAEAARNGKDNPEFIDGEFLKNAKELWDNGTTTIRADGKEHQISWKDYFTGKAPHEELADPMSEEAWQAISDWLGNSDPNAKLEDLKIDPTVLTKIKTTFSKTGNNSEYFLRDLFKNGREFEAENERYNPATGNFETPYKVAIRDLNSSNPNDVTYFRPDLLWESNAGIDGKRWIDMYDWKPNEEGAGKSIYQMIHYARHAEEMSQQAWDRKQKGETPQKDDEYWLKYRDDQGGFRIRDLIGKDYTGRGSDVRFSYRDAAKGTIDLVMQDFKNANEFYKAARNSDAVFDGFELMMKAGLIKGDEKVDTALQKYVGEGETYEKLQQSINEYRASHPTGKDISGKEVFSGQDYVREHNDEWNYLVAKQYKNREKLDATMESLRGMKGKYSQFASTDSEYSQFDFLYDDIKSLQDPELIAALSSVYQDVLPYAIQDIGKYETEREGQAKLLNNLVGVAAIQDPLMAAESMQRQLYGSTGNNVFDQVRKVVSRANVAAGTRQTFKKPFEEFFRQYSAEDVADNVWQQAGQIKAEYDKYAGQYDNTAEGKAARDAYQDFVKNILNGTYEFDQKGYNTDDFMANAAKYAAAQENIDQLRASERDLVHKLYEDDRKQTVRDVKELTGANKLPQERVQAAIEKREQDVNNYIASAKLDDKRASADITKLTNSLSVDFMKQNADALKNAIESGDTVQIDSLATNIDVKDSGILDEIKDLMTKKQTLQDAIKQLNEYLNNGFKEFAQMQNEDAQFETATQEFGATVGAQSLLTQLPGQQTTIQNAEEMRKAQAKYNTTRAVHSAKKQIEALRKIENRSDYQNSLLTDLEGFVNSPTAQKEYQENEEEKIKAEADMVQWQRNQNIADMQYQNNMAHDQRMHSIRRQHANMLLPRSRSAILNAINQAKEARYTYNGKNNEYSLYKQAERERDKYQEQQEKQEAVFKAKHHMEYSEYQKLSDEEKAEKGDDMKNDAAKIAATAENVKKYNNAMEEAQDASKKFGSVLPSMSAGLNKVNSVAANVIKRFGRRMFYQAINEAKRFVKEFDASMTTIQMITLKTDSEMSKLGDGLIAQAKELKVSISEVSKVYEALYRQGLNDAEVEERAGIITKFSKVAGIDPTNATKLITIATQTGLATAQEAADIVTMLGDNAATNAAEIEKGVEKAGAAAAADGTTFAQLASMLTAIVSTTQIGGNVAGRTLNTIFGRMNKIGTTELIYDENGNAISGSDVAKLLSRQGISMYDESGNKRSSYDVLYEISQKWEEMSDATQQQLATAIAGTRQYSNFAAIMMGMKEGKVDEYMDLAGDSEGILDKKNEIRLKSLQAAIDTVKNAWDEMINTMIDSGQLTEFANGLANIITNLGGIVGQLIQMKTLAPTILALMGALKGAQLGATIGSGWGALAGAVIGGSLGLAGGLAINSMATTSTYHGEKETSKKNLEDYNDALNSIKKYDSELGKTSRAEELRLKGETRSESENDEYKKIITELVYTYGLTQEIDKSINSVDSLTESANALGKIAEASAKQLDIFSQSIINNSKKEIELKQTQATIQAVPGAAEKIASANKTLDWWNINFTDAGGNVLGPGENQNDSYSDYIYYDSTAGRYKSRLSELSTRYVQIEGVYTDEYGREVNSSDEIAPIVLEFMNNKGKKSFTDLMSGFAGYLQNKYGETKFGDIVYNGTPFKDVLTGATAAKVPGNDLLSESTAYNIVNSLLRFPEEYIESNTAFIPSNVAEWIQAELGEYVSSYLGVHWMDHALRQTTPYDILIDSLGPYLQALIPDVANNPEYMTYAMSALAGKIKTGMSADEIANIINNELIPQSGDIDSIRGNYTRLVNEGANTSLLSSVKLSGKQGVDYYMYKNGNNRERMEVDYAQMQVNREVEKAKEEIIKSLIPESEDRDKSIDLIDSNLTGFKDFYNSDGSNAQKNLNELIEEYITKDSELRDAAATEYVKREKEILSSYELIRNMAANAVETGYYNEWLPENQTKLDADYLIEFLQNSNYEDYNTLQEAINNDVRASAAWQRIISSNGEAAKLIKGFGTNGESASENWKWNLIQNLANDSLNYTNFYTPDEQIGIVAGITYTGLRNKEYYLSEAEREAKEREQARSLLANNLALARQPAEEKYNKALEEYNKALQSGIDDPTYYQAAEKALREAEEELNNLPPVDIDAYLAEHPEFKPEDYLTENNITRKKILGAEEEQVLQGIIGSDLTYKSKQGNLTDEEDRLARILITNRGRGISELTARQKRNEISRLNEYVEKNGGSLAGYSAIVARSALNGFSRAEEYIDLMSRRSNLSPDELKQLQELQQLYENYVRNLDISIEVEGIKALEEAGELLDGTTAKIEQLKKGGRFAIEATVAIQVEAATNADLWNKFINGSPNEKREALKQMIPGLTDEIYDKNPEFFMNYGMDLYREKAGEAEESYRIIRAEKVKTGKEEEYDEMMALLGYEWTPGAIEEYKPKGTGVKNELGFEEVELVSDDGYKIAKDADGNPVVLNPEGNVDQKRTIDFLNGDGHYTYNPSSPDYLNPFKYAEEKFTDLEVATMRQKIANGLDYNSLQTERDRKLYQSAMGAMTTEEYEYARGDKQYEEIARRNAQEAVTEAQIKYDVSGVESLEKAGKVLEGTSNLISEIKEKGTINIKERIEFESSINTIQQQRALLENGSVEEQIQVMANITGRSTTWVRNNMGTARKLTEAMLAPKEEAVANALTAMYEQGGQNRELAKEIAENTGHELTYGDIYYDENGPHQEIKYKRKDGYIAPIDRERLLTSHEYSASELADIRGTLFGFASTNNQEGYFDYIQNNYDDYKAGINSLGEKGKKYFSMLEENDAYIKANGEAKYSQEEMETAWGEAIAENNIAERDLEIATKRTNLSNKRYSTAAGAQAYAQFEYEQSNKTKLAAKSLYNQLQEGETIDALIARLGETEEGKELLQSQEYLAYTQKYTGATEEEKRRGLAELAGLSTGRLTKRDYATSARYGLSLNNEYRTADSVYAERIRSIYGDEVYQDWLAGKQIDFTSPAMAAKENAYVYGKSMTSGEKVAQIKTIAAMTQEELAAITDEEQLALMDEAMSGFANWAEYRRLSAAQGEEFEKLGGQKRLSDLNEQLKLYQKNAEIDFEIEGLQTLEEAGELLEGTTNYLKQLKKDGRFEIQAIVKMTTEYNQQGQIDARLHSSDAATRAQAVMEVTGATEEQYYESKESQEYWENYAQEIRSADRPAAIKSLSEARAETENKEHFDKYVAGVAGYEWVNDGLPNGYYLGEDGLLYKEGTNEKANSTVQARYNSGAYKDKYHYRYNENLIKEAATGKNYSRMFTNTQLAGYAAEAFRSGLDWNDYVDANIQDLETRNALKEYSPDLYKWMNMDEEQKASAEGQNLKRKIELQFEIEGIRQLEEAGELLAGTTELVEQLKKGGKFEIEARIKLSSDLYEQSQLYAMLNSGNEDLVDKAAQQITGVTGQRYYDNRDQWITNARASIEAQQAITPESLMTDYLAAPDKEAFLRDLEGTGWSLSFARNGFSVKPQFVFRPEDYVYENPYAGIENQVLTEAELARMRIAIDNETLTNENINYDFAMQSGGQAWKRYQWMLENQDKYPDLISADDIETAKLEWQQEEAAAQSSRLSGYSSAFNQARSAQYAIDNYTGLNAGTIASYLSMDEETIKEMMKTDEGKQVLQDKINEQAVSLYTAMARDLGIEIDATDTESLKSQLQEAADNAEGQLKFVLQSMADALTDAGEIIGNSGFDTFEQIVTKQLEPKAQNREAMSAVSNAIQTGNYASLLGNNDVNWETVDSGLLYMLYDRANGGTAFSNEMISGAYQNALLGRKSSPETQQQILSNLFGGNLSAENMISTYQMWMQDQEKYAGEIAAYQSLEGLDNVTEAMTSEYNATDKTSKALEEYNKQVGINQIDYLNKYGKATANVADYVTKLGQGAKSAVPAIGSLVSNMNKLGYQNKQLQAMTGKAGSQLSSEQLDIVSEITGFDKSVLKTYGADMMTSVVEGAKDVIDQQWAEEIASPMVGQINEALKGENAIQLARDIEISTDVNGQIDIKQLASLVKAYDDNLYSVLAAYDGTGATLFANLEANENGVGYVLDLIRAGAGTSGTKPGGGGGGGKSKVDKLLEAQKRKVTAAEHDVKMLEIAEKEYDYRNDYSGWSKNIDEQIAAQLKLKDVYAANIAEMKEMLANTKEGSDDWYKLKEAIYSAEEAFASINSTINELNSKNISILEQKQQNQDKPNAHLQSMLEKLGQRAMSEDRFNDYLMFAQQRITEINAQKTLNEVQLAEWESQLSDYEEGSDAWIEVRDKIWALEEENAELENQAIQQTLELNEQRLAQIAKVLQYDTGTAVHNNAIASTYGNAYQSGGYRSAYEDMLRVQLGSNKTIIDENLKAEQKAIEQMNSLEEGTAAWYSARAAVYQYQEAIAQTEATQMELNHSLAESNIQSVAEGYEDATREALHVNEMLEKQAQAYLEANDYKAYNEAMTKYLGNTSIAIDAQREALAKLQDQYREGMENGTLDPAMQREYQNQINQAESNLQELLIQEQNKQKEVDKNNLDYLFEVQDRAASDYSHNLQLVQYQSTRYQNAGELTNYGKAIEVDTELRKDRVEALKDEISALKEQREYYQEKYGEGSDDEIRIVEQIKKREEALESENVQIEKNNKLLEENQKKIRQVQKTLEDAVDKEIEAQKKREREMLASNVSMQNTILDLLKKRLQDEWNLKKKDIEKEKESLNEYKKLINERFNYRKKAAQQADKDEELAEYRRQLALIEADPSRTKDAKELRRKIEELEEEKAWTIAEDELANETDRIDENIQSMDNYISYNEEKLNELLSDANNFATELGTILSGSFEESYDKIIEFMQKENEAFMKSLPDAQQQMIQGWEDTWKKANDIVDSNYAMITTILRDKDTYMEYMKNTNRDYRSYLENGDENSMRILETTWSDYYDNYIASIKNDAEIETHEHPIGDVISKIDELKENVFQVNIIGISGAPPTAYGFDEDGFRWYDRSNGEGYTLNDYAGIGKVAEPAEESKRSSSSSSKASSNPQTAYVYGIIDKNGYYTSNVGTVMASSPEEAQRKANAEAQKRSPGSRAVFTSQTTSVNTNNASSTTSKSNDGLSGWDLFGTSDKEKTNEEEKRKNKLGIFGPNANGGLIDYTGLAWVDGSMIRPESFLDSVDTSLLREMLDTYSYIRTTPYMSNVDTSQYVNNTSVGDVNITINQAELKSDADIASLAKRVGQAFTKELKVNGISMTGYNFA